MTHWCPSVALFPASPSYALVPACSHDFCGLGGQSTDTAKATASAPLPASPALPIPQALRLWGLRHHVVQPSHLRGGNLGTANGSRLTQSHS